LDKAQNLTRVRPSYQSPCFTYPCTRVRAGTYGSALQRSEQADSVKLKLTSMAFFVQVGLFIELLVAAKLQNIGDSCNQFITL
jgi:hypothetical protein